MGRVRWNTRAIRRSSIALAVCKITQNLNAARLLYGWRKSRPSRRFRTIQVCLKD
jgi:hypothetical protein